MLRRQARLRREYLYRKSVEDKHKQLQEKKERLKYSLEEGVPIHGDLRREALSLQDKLKWTDEGKLDNSLASTQILVLKFFKMYSFQMYRTRSI